MTTVRTVLDIINIHPVTHQSYYVQWDIDVSQAGPGPFTFKLFRSGSPRGPWTEVATGLTGYTHQDTFPLLQGMNKDLYYKVETTDGSIKSLPRHTQRGLPRKKFLIIRKIMKDELKMLRAGNGTKVFVVKKRHWGTRCLECYDVCTGHVVKKNCGACFGTTFENGYFDPIEVLSAIKPTMLGTDYTAQTSVPEVDTANAFLQAFPTVIKGDFLVEFEVNKRWEVTAVTPTEILRNTVHQDLTMTRLPTSHEIYKVPVGGI